jgi:uncharacterized integral membrane protein
MHDPADHSHDVHHAGEFEEAKGVSPTLIGFLVIAVVTVIFIVQNSEKTEIRFLFISVTSRLWIAIITAIALGVVLDRLFTSWWRRRQQR